MTNLPSPKLYLRRWTSGFGILRSFLAMCFAWGGVPSLLIGLLMWIMARRSESSGDRRHPGSESERGVHTRTQRTRRPVAHGKTRALSIAATVGMAMGDEPAVGTWPSGR